MVSNNECNCCSNKLRGTSSEGFLSLALYVISFTALCCLKLLLCKTSNTKLFSSGGLTNSNLGGSGGSPLPSWFILGNFLLFFFKGPSSFYKYTEDHNIIIKNNVHVFAKILVFRFDHKSVALKLYFIKKTNLITFCFSYQDSSSFLFINSQVQRFFLFWFRMFHWFEDPVLVSNLILLFSICLHYLADC